MDPANPLTRQFQDTFQPKVVQLYQTLFDLNDSDEHHENIIYNEGFWRELFLLKPEKQKLTEVLEPLTGAELLHIQGQTRCFFRKAITEAGSGVSPQNENALENLSAFMAGVLAKRFTNPSTDIIEVLAGLDTIDKAMSDLVNGMEVIIRQSKTAMFRAKAVEVVLATVAGSYQTSLITYFMHKDFFPGLVKYVRESPDSCRTVLPLLGLLANHNKFEAQNVYQNRMEDFVGEECIAILINNIAEVCSDIRARYVAVQDDSPSQWSVSSTLSSIGLRALTPEAKKPPPSEEEAKALFNALPPLEAAGILTAYSFTQANNVFASALITQAVSNGASETPQATFLSAASYLTNHAHRNYRTQAYAILSLLTIRLLLEDSILAKRLSSSSDLINVRHCRQRPPHLPHSSGARPATAHILDILASSISHNLRLRLSVPLFTTTLQILHTTLVHLSTTKTRLHNYTNWSTVWMSLLSLLRFLTTYASDVQKFHTVSVVQKAILTPLLAIIVFALLRGDDFLPDPSSYDDLFYKLIEISSGGEESMLHRFVSLYKIKKVPAGDRLARAMNALLEITAHYQELLAGKGKKKVHQSPREVTKVIREGYEGLGGVVDGVAAGAGSGNVAPGEYFGQTERWRESEWKAEMKRILRVVVEDARGLAVQ